MSTFTVEQKKKIYEFIGAKMAPDDKEPAEVIEESFGGDEEAYLKRMVEWHNIQLN